MSGKSRPSLGVQVLAFLFFISQGKSQFKQCLGKRLEVPDILLPDIRDLLIVAFWGILKVEIEIFKRDLKFLRGFCWGDAYKTLPFLTSCDDGNIMS